MLLLCDTESVYNKVCSAKQTLTITPVLLCSHVFLVHKVFFIWLSIWKECVVWVVLVIGSFQNCFDYTNLLYES